MRKKPFWPVIYCVLLLVMVAAEALAFLAIIRLDMLPGIYLAVLCGLFLALTLVVGCLLFGKRGRGRKIAAFVVMILLLCGSAVLYTVANDVIHTFEATKQEELGSMTRAVYVLKDNPAQDLQDTTGFTYGYVKHYDESNTRQVLKEVSLQTNGQVITAGFNNHFLMVNALLEDRIDAIVLSGGYVSILEGTDEFIGLSEEIRVLESIEVIEQQTQPEMSVDIEKPLDAEAVEEPTQDALNIPAEPEVGEVDYSALEPFIVYVSGSDSYEDEIIHDGRSDVNILAVVNPLSKQILLLNTPRDYYVQNTAGNYQRDKLTHCGMYGIGCSMETLGNLYDVQIDYYVRINFSGFKKLIDALGGVTVYSDYAFTAITRTPIQEGENHLTGQQALDFARERYTLPGGDNERGKHQMQVITAVIEKATSGTAIISNYSDIMASVEGMFTMNIPIEMVSNLIKMQLSDLARWNVSSYAVTGSDAMEECYSAPGMDLAVIVPYDSDVYKATRLIDMIYDGEILTQEVINSIG